MDSEKLQSDIAATKSSATAKSFVEITKLIVFVSGLTTMAAVIAPNWWVGDLCANLRIQWVVAQCCGLLVLLLAQRWKSSIGCLCLGMVNCVAIANGLGLLDKSAVDADHKACITVCTFNVLTTNEDFDSIERELLKSDADVIVIPELSSGLEKHLNGGFVNSYRWSCVDSRDGGNFGIGLYSRHPFDSSEIFMLNINIPSIEVSFTVAEARYHVVATHTIPPIGSGGFNDRNKHLDMLATRVRGICTQDPDLTVIVAGDLNLTPWSPVFDQFCKQSGLSRTGGGVQPTWYRFPAFPFGLVLDHVLTSHHLSCLTYEVGESAGSDHCPVTASFARVR